MNKGTKSYTSGNKIELHKNKIIYGTKSYTFGNKIIYGTKSYMFGNKNELHKEQKNIKEQNYL
jgi:hypothetical protein